MVTENKKIAIIGAGQLGSRHLQGACKSSIKVDIEVVDPSESAIEIARERFYEVDNRTNVINIKFFESIEQLSDTLDLVIVATTSGVRFQVS